MKLHELFKFFTISTKLAQEISHRLQRISLVKGNYFVQINEKMNRLGILISGLLIARFVSEEGALVASKLYYPTADIIVVDYLAFKRQQHSIEEIEVLEDAELFTLSYQAFTELKESYPAFQRLVADFAEESYIKTLRTLRLLQTANAKARIQRFLNLHAAVVGKLKVEDKAALLGISRNSYTNNLKSL